MAEQRRFTTRLIRGKGDRRLIPLPFDPAQHWGERPRYHVSGTVGGLKVRGPLESTNDGFALGLGAAWCRDAAFDLDKEVEVVLSPEGPQQDALADDIATALAAEPAASQFFDSLATFYRKAYLRWIDSTKRNPEERAARIVEMVRLLKAGQKQR